MNKIHAFVIALALTSCAGVSSQQIGPSTVDITCKSRPDCWEEASNVCGRNSFRVDSVATEPRASILVGTTVIHKTRTSMIVTCLRRTE